MGPTAESIEKSKLYQNRKRKKVGQIQDYRFILKQYFTMFQISKR